MRRRGGEEGEGEGSEEEVHVLAEPLLAGLGRPAQELLHPVGDDAFLAGVLEVVEGGEDHVLDELVGEAVLEKIVLVLGLVGHAVEGDGIVN